MGLTDSAAEVQGTSTPTLARVGRLGGPLLALLAYAFFSHFTSLPSSGNVAGACAVLMASFWITEALPLPVTSLLPLIVLPLGGVLRFTEAAAPYANPVIFLFMGGFMIAMAIERWNLHVRLALLTLRAVGPNPRALVFGFMATTGFLSMWISNTAAAMMMLPIATSTARLMGQQRRGDATCQRRFIHCLLLSVAYGASIGGLGTIIGTPPNAFLVGFLHKQGLEIGFGHWMIFAVPLMLLTLAITWVLLSFVIFRIDAEPVSGQRELLNQRLAELGPLQRGEWVVLGAFSLTASLWVFRGPLTNWDWLVNALPVVTRLSDATTAMLGAVLLFALPVDWRRGIFALDWPTARKLPWGLLLLFGGGLSLAEGLSISTFTDWVGSLVAHLQGLPPLLLSGVVVTLVIFLTEITSNTATAAAFLPVLFGVANGLKMSPPTLVVPAALAASCAFMLPVATPPNAIVFGSGEISISEMARAGFLLNLVCTVLITCYAYWLVPLLLS